VNQLFSTLAEAVGRSAPVALTASFVWGVLSIVLSPCHLSSVPLVIGYITGQGGSSARRAIHISLLFSAGILATIAFIGAITASLGRMMGDVGPYTNYVVALVFFLIGLHLLDVVHLPWLGGGPRSSPRRGLLGAFILGLLFGIGVGPCTFAYMAPMLGIAFQVAATRPLYAIALLSAYGIGHCSVIVLAGSSTDLVQRYLDWSGESRGPIWIRRICGVLVIFGGLYLIYTA